MFTAEPDLFRRNLQRNYVGSMIDLLNAKPTAATSSRFFRSVSISDNSDVKAVVRGTLNTLQNELKSMPADNAITKYHYDDLVYRLEKALDPDN